MTSSLRLLKWAVAVGGIVPVGAGLTGIILGPPMVQAVSGIILDSHFRYLSGLLLGIGLGFWSLIPSLDRDNPRFRLLAIIVFIGGLGRLVSLIGMGVPNRSMLFGLFMELGLTPLLAFWQYKIGKERL